MVAVVAREIVVSEFETTVLVRLEGIEGSLREHMRRTEMLEEKQSQVDEALKPINTHIAMWSGAMKALTVFGAVLAAGAGFIGLLRYLLYPLRVSHCAHQR